MLEAGTKLSSLSLFPSLPSKAFDPENLGIEHVYNFRTRRVLGIKIPWAGMRSGSKPGKFWVIGTITKFAILWRNKRIIIPYHREFLILPKLSHEFSDLPVSAAYLV